MNRKILQRVLWMLLTLCLAFSLLGGTGRLQPVSEEVDALLSASFDEQSTEAGETPASDEAEVVEPKIAEVTTVEESDEPFQAPEMSSYCNREYAGSYKVYSGHPYVCAQGVFSALYPNARFTQTEEGLSIEAGDITVEARFGEKYFTSNGRYLYAPAGVISTDDGVYLPADSLAKCFGGTVSLDETAERLDIFATDITPLNPGDGFYNEDDVYWLSRIIYAEAGIESLEGQIAVGNVVINRVASSVFPQDNIKDVIFAKGQFDPVAAGTVNRTPSDEAVVAAKLALDGCKMVPDYTLFFATFHLGSGYTAVTWIGNHCFMALA